MSTKTNILIEQGATFTVPIELTDEDDNAIDVTNLVANAQLRKYAGASNSVSFDTALQTGELTLSMNAATTATITPGRYFYDVLLTDTVSDVVTRLVEGIVTVTPGITANT